MPRAGAKKIVNQYAKQLKRQKYSFSAIYLFGSYAKGKPRKWSDIDVAVVTPELRKNYEHNRFALWDARVGVDSRIEPHGFTPEDFKNDADPMVHEIKTTGIRIA